MTYEQALRTLLASMSNAINNHDSAKVQVLVARYFWVRGSGRYYSKKVIRTTRLKLEYKSIFKRYLRTTPRYLRHDGTLTRVKYRLWWTKKTRCFVPRAPRPALTPPHSSEIYNYLRAF